jgi:uncharacterized protein (TIGR02145 family)
MKRIVPLLVLVCFVIGIAIVESCKKDPVIPTLTTAAVTNITINSVTSGGSITKDGGAGVTARGVCWGTSENPTTAGSYTSDDKGIGSFISNITDLIPNTLYHIRAYATNKAGTAYGEDISFTTTPIVVPTLTTTEVTSVTLTTAVTGGNITADGNASVTSKGVCWATTTAPTITNSITTDGTGSGSFVSNLSGLQPGITYYLRAYATNSAGTAYGNEVSFTTSPTLVPTLATAAVTSVTLTTAVSGGNITTDGGGAVTVRGVCWSTAANPIISNPKTSDGTGIGTFISSITGLLPGTLYHIRAYATNSAGTAYGSDVTFTTTAVGAPTLTTASVTSVTQTTAVSGGNITSDGGSSVTARGTCWATTTNPTVANFKTSDNSGTGSFVSNLTGLTPGATYYVRAYATNAAGTAYGNEISFNAVQVSLPTLTTTAMSSITATTAVSGGNVLTNGGGTVTGRGVCYSLTASPTITSPNTSDGSGTGVFVSNLTGLTPGATYHLRAYAVNSAGPAYGTEITFTALATNPTVTTTTASAITQTTATSGGNVTYDGGGTIIARGTCWALTAAPTTSNFKTSETPGTGSFVSNLSSLLPGTTYHYRAYVTNGISTAYGTENTFTTLVALPIVTTTAATSIAQKTAVAGGNVTSDGGGAIIAAGTCWAKTANPTTGSSKTTDATTTGSFISNLAGLDAGTLYHIRAYATNSAGTSYGDDLTFTTIDPTPPVVTTAAVSGIINNAAVSGGSITDDGNGIISAKGVCWSTSTGPTVSDSKTNEGGGTASFVSNLGPLLPGTTYYVRAYATNSLGTTAYGTEISFKTMVADADGNLYNWVVINGQVWLTEDLKTTKYEDGSAITLVTSSATWSSTTAPGYCWYNNDIANKSTYGALYNWYAVDVASNGSKNVCPALWHVPTELELEALITFVGGPTVAGGVLKEAGTSHWTMANGSNDVNFTALPGGERVSTDGGFAEMGTDSYHWSSTIDESDNTLGLGQSINTGTTTTTKSGFHKTAGASVRCIKN